MQIQEYKFSSFIIDNKIYMGDIKIINNKIRYWDREGHDLKLEQIKDLINVNPKTIVIGTGASGLLKVSDEIKKEAISKKIKLIIEKTEKACNICNELLKQGTNFAAILHSTC